MMGVKLKIIVEVDKEVDKEVERWMWCDERNLVNEVNYLIEAKDVKIEVKWRDARGVSPVAMFPYL